MSDNGLITIPSSWGVTETMDRIEQEARSRGMTVFARIDHTAGAEEVGLLLRPTLPLVFGNAKGGTPLMQADQRLGIDLPLKVLVWQDASGKAWLSYNDPVWTASRHALGPELDEVVENLSAALSSIAQNATSSPL